MAAVTVAVTEMTAKNGSSDAVSQVPEASPLGKARAERLGGMRVVFLVPRCFKWVSS